MCKESASLATSDANHEGNYNWLMTPEIERPLLPELPENVVQLLNDQPGALNERMGIKFISASREALVATMPVEGNTQPMGILHGGASGVIAETVGSVGSAIHAMQFELIPVGVELSCTHHRSASEGMITATGIPITLGKTLASWEIVLTDDAGRRTCTSRLTCFLKKT